LGERKCSYLRFVAIGAALTLTLSRRTGEGRSATHGSKSRPTTPHDSPWVHFVRSSRGRARASVPLATFDQKVCRSSFSHPMGEGRDEGPVKHYRNRPHRLR